MVRVGVIGCGKIAQVRHLPEYAANPGVQIAGLFDLNAARAQALAEQYGAKAYSSCEALLADKSIDAVSICTANATHAQMTIAALEAGKHVLCEKPMATTLEDCERMVAVAKARGLRLMIGQNQRLTEAHEKARDMIRAGEIGRVLTFTTAFRHSGPETWSVDPGANTWFFDKSIASLGVMADLGVHKTDLIQFLLGQTITEVTAQMATLEKTRPDGTPIPVDDNDWCIYRMDGSAVGTMVVSWTNHGPEDNATIINGTEGVLSLYADPAHPLTLTRRDGTVTHYDVGRIQTNDDQTASGVIDLFVDCLRNPNLEGISAESVLPAMRAVFAAVESAQTGRTVRIQ